MSEQPHLSDTQIIDAVEARLEERIPRSRHIEDALAVAGIVQALVYGTIEALRLSGVAFGKCEAATGFPWVTITILALCVAPKTLGRATAGKVWESISGRLGGAKP